MPPCEYSKTAVACRKCRNIYARLVKLSEKTGQVKWLKKIKNSKPPMYKRLVKDFSSKANEVGFGKNKAPYSVYQFRTQQYVDSGKKLSGQCNRLVQKLCLNPAV